MRWLLAMLSALASSAVCLAAPPLPVEERTFDFSGSSGRYVLLLNVDALSERTFHEMLDAGRLPNLSRMLREKGGRVGRLVSAFPSSSAPAIPEFFHGRFLDRSSTLPRKVHAFDRETLQSLRYTFKDRDWVDDQVDVWDICAAGDIPTVMFYLRGYDGVDEARFRQKYLAWDSLFEFLKLPRLMNFDKRSLKDAARLYATSPRPPQLAYIWCDTLDVTGHIHGPYSDVYRRSLEEIDRGLGWLFDAMRGRRLPEGDTLYDRASILLFGDHGLSASSGKVRIGRYLKREGLRLRDTSLVKQFISEYLKRPWATQVDAVFVPGGSTVAELYVRPRSGAGRAPWTHRLTRADLERFGTPRHPGGIDLPRELAAIEGVDVVLVKETAGAVRVISNDRGEAVVKRVHRGGRDLYAYVPEASGDPFGYLRTDLAAELVTGPGDPEPRLASASVWLQATVGTSYPFAPVRLPHAYGVHPTESDVILVARPGWDFLAHSKGDHGGLDPETMLTPFIIAGADAGRGPTPLVTTVDLMPTVLELLGIRASNAYLSCLDGVAVDRTGSRDLLAALPGRP